MALKEINVGGTMLLVEVTEIEAPVKGRFEDTALDERKDLADRISNLVGALTHPVKAAIEATGAEEWELEVNFGFSGEAGLPFITKAETNASVKVTAKWKKGA